MFDTMAYRWFLKYQISLKFSLFIVGELYKFQMSGFSLIQVKQFKKGHSDHLELSENSEFPARQIMGFQL